METKEAFIRLFDLPEYKELISELPIADVQAFYQIQSLNDNSMYALSSTNGVFIIKVKIDNTLVQL